MYTRGSVTESMTCTSRAGMAVGSGTFAASVFAIGCFSSAETSLFCRYTTYWGCVPGGGGMKATMLLTPPMYLNVYSASSRISRRTRVPRATVALPVAIEHPLPRPHNVYITLFDDETLMILSPLAFVPRTPT